MGGAYRRCYNGRQACSAGRRDNDGAASEAYARIRGGSADGGENGIEIRSDQRDVLMAVDRHLLCYLTDTGLLLYALMSGRINVRDRARDGRRANGAERYRYNLR